MKAISSADNPNFKRWLRLAESPRAVRTHRRTLAEGIHLAQAIHAAGQGVEAVVVRRGSERADVRTWITAFAAVGAPVFELSASLYDRLAPVERGSGLLLVSSVPDVRTVRSGDALYLDGIQDPGNAGALLRVAAASGVRVVLAAPGTVALWSPKVLRGAQGAHFRLQLLEDVEATAVRTMLTMPWIGATAHGGTPLWRAPLTEAATGFMVGSEGAGLSAAAATVCTHQITIPLAEGVESLNVVAAAAICLFERRRQIALLQARPLPSA